jgi:hypothetical protein
MNVNIAFKCIQIIILHDRKKWINWSNQRRIDWPSRKWEKINLKRDDIEETRLHGSLSPDNLSPTICLRQFISDNLSPIIYPPTIYLGHLISDSLSPDNFSRDSLSPGNLSQVNLSPTSDLRPFISDNSSPENVSQDHLSPLNLSRVILSRTIYPQSIYHRKSLSLTNYRRFWISNNFLPSLFCPYTVRVFKDKN